MSNPHEVLDWESDDSRFGERKTYVNIDGEWIDTDKVEFLGISEGMFGEDIMTFRYRGRRMSRSVHSR